METFLLTFYIVFCTLQQKNTILPPQTAVSYSVNLRYNMQTPLVSKGSLLLFILCCSVIRVNLIGSCARAGLRGQYPELVDLVWLMSDS